MMKTTLEIENLKCHGCVTGIQKKLTGKFGIAALQVDLEHQTVIFDSEASVDLPKIEKTLTKMGYPPKGTLSGLSNLAAKAQSFVSCSIGKFDL